MSHLPYAQPLWDRQLYLGLLVPPSRRRQSCESQLVGDAATAVILGLAWLAENDGEPCDGIATAAHTAEILVLYEWYGASPILMKS